MSETRFYWIMLIDHILSIELRCSDDLLPTRSSIGRMGARFWLLFYQIQQNILSTLRGRFERWHEWFGNFKSDASHSDVVNLSFVCCAVPIEPNQFYRLWDEHEIGVYSVTAEHLYDTKFHLMMSNTHRSTVYANRVRSYYYHFVSYAKVFTRTSSLSSRSLGKNGEYSW